jgi:hypothetical protein
MLRVLFYLSFVATLAFIANGIYEKNSKLNLYYENKLKVFNEKSKSYHRSHGR